MVELEPQEKIDARRKLEMRALTAMRNRCFISAVGLGFLSGAMGPVMAGAPWTRLVFEGFMGIILIMICGFLGGLMGMIVRNLTGYLLGRGVEAGDTTLDGVVLGGFAGAFVGLVVKLILWRLSSAAMGVALGALVGSFAGALPGEHVTVVARMLAVERHLETGKRTSDDNDDA